MRSMSEGGTVPAAGPDAARRVGIVGAGVIGGGWALHYLRMGFHVDVHDPGPGARDGLLRMLESAWPVLERLGLRSGASPDRLTFCRTLGDAVGGRSEERRVGKEWRTGREAQSQEIGVVRR